MHLLDSSLKYLVTSHIFIYSFCIYSFINKYFLTYTQKRGLYMR